MSFGSGWTRLDALFRAALARQRPRPTCRTLTVCPHKAANEGRIGPFELHSRPCAEKRLDARTTPASQAGLENRTRWRAGRVDQRWSALPRKKVFTAAESKRYILDSITRPS